MNIFKKNNIIDGLVITIKLILMLLSGCMFGLIRRLKFYPKLELSIAECVSNIIGYEFSPKWVGCLLFTIACCIILILFISEGFNLTDLINLFKKESLDSEISILTPKQSKKRRK